jgi:hypothetical protein
LSFRFQTAWHHRIKSSMSLIAKPTRAWLRFTANF